MKTDPTIRPLQTGDVAEASRTAYDSLREMVNRIDDEGWPERQPPDDVARSEARIEHLRVTDPQGSWVAEHDGRIVGIALATKRESIWFLSLMAVAVDFQSAGLGKKLLDAALTYAQDCRGAWIMSSADPRALHRYGSAGFALHAAYETSAIVDRSLLPAVTGVREGSFEADFEWISDLARTIRGAGYGPDEPAYRSRNLRVLTVREGSERAYSLIGNRGIFNLGATSPELASRMLTASVAEGTTGGGDGEFSFGCMTSTQQWAIDIAIALKFPLRARVSICTRGQLGPLTPYIPNGAYG